MLINDALLPEEEGLIVGFVLDINERKKAEEESRASEVQIELQRRLLGEREEERLQVARDLHDGPLQDLIAAGFLIQGLQGEEDPDQIQEQLAELRQVIQGLMSDLRAYATELRPPALATFGLERGIRSHLEEFRRKHPTIKVHFSAYQEGGLTHPEVRTALYRIYQECMNNVIKHSQASEIWIRFTKDEQTLMLEIRDNGGGFEMPRDRLALARQGHLGLVGMRERAEAIGARLEVDS